MILRLVIIVLLILLNGFFVAAEFAIVKSRRTRLEAMARGGDRLSRLALRASHNVPALLSACQLGVTLASLSIGWAAEATLGEALVGVFERLPGLLDVGVRATIAGVVALIIVTYFHVVFGELTPRSAALNNAERLARWLVPPLMAFAWVAKPFVWVLNQSSLVVLALLHQKPAGSEDSVHSPEELRILVEQSQESGALENADAELIDAVFEFSEKNAREVMTPRTDIVALPLESTLDEVLATVEESGLSRYPVYEESIDDIVGLVLAKDLLRVVARPPEAFSLRSVMRPVHVIPGSREVEDVLADFKRLKEHLAVVLDEYGGTAGVVTMEDLLEEIVGEILDEYDEPEDETVRTRAGETLVPGSTHVSELNERFGLAVPEEDYTTIAGYVFGALGRLPAAGDRITAGGATFTVSEMDGRRIATLAMEVSPAEEAVEQSAPQSGHKAVAPR